MIAVKTYTRMVAATVLATALGSAAAQEAPQCCHHCGGTVGVRRICLPVHTTRPEKIESWDAARELIAIPAELRSCRSGIGACTSCNTGHCDRCTAGCHTAGKLRPRNRLLRKTLLEEVPTTVWTVHYVCASCAASMYDNPPEATTDLPPDEQSDSALELIWQAMCKLVRLHRS